jgi:hypothetical protein
MIPQIKKAEIYPQNRSYFMKENLKSKDLRIFEIINGIRMA